MMENAWKYAARHWWKRMRDAERERDEWRLRASRAEELYDHQRDEIKRAYRDGLGGY